jgi:hypothetical protein
MRFGFKDRCPALQISKPCGVRAKKRCVSRASPTHHIPLTNSKLTGDPTLANGPVGVSLPVT